MVYCLKSRFYTLLMYLNGLKFKLCGVVLFLDLPISFFFLVVFHCNILLFFKYTVQTIQVVYLDDFYCSTFYTHYLSRSTIGYSCYVCRLSLKVYFRALSYSFLFLLGIFSPCKIVFNITIAFFSVYCVLELSYPMSYLWVLFPNTWFMRCPFSSIKSGCGYLMYILCLTKIYL